MIRAALALATVPARLTLAVAREVAELRLAVVDADVARWYVDDGQLSEEPLNDHPAPESLVRRRREAVDLLEFLGGNDPHAIFMHPPTEAQRRGYAARHR